MALPKIANTPYYDVTIPSTGEKTRYRPYLVKEEKILLMAAESTDDTQMSDAMLDIICTCFENINPHKLTTFDMEYLFLQLRSKSVGESIDLVYACLECEAENTVKVELAKSKPNIPKDKNNKITLKENMILELKYPTYYDIIKDKVLQKSESNYEIIYQTVMLCLDKLQVNDEIMRFADEPVEDVIEFIGNLSAEQFKKLSSFAETIPFIKQEVNFECKSCKHPNVIEIEGMNNFFL